MVEEDSNNCGTGKIVYRSLKNMKDSFGHHRVRVYGDMAILKEIVRLRIEAQDEEQDSLYAVCAPEGMGKSTLALWAYSLFLFLKGLDPDVDFKIENICFNIPELLNKVSSSPGKEFFVLDESSEISGTRFMEKKSKDITEAFVLMRQRANIIFLCFPNVLRLNTYFREDRIRGVWFIKSRGEAWYYPNSPEHPLLTMILDRWGKDYDVKSIRFFTRYAPSFIVKFPKIGGALWREYNKRKKSNIDKVLGEHSVKHGFIQPGVVGVLDGNDLVDMKRKSKMMGEDVGVDRTNLLTYREVASKLNISYPTIIAMVRKKKLIPIYINGRSFIDARLLTFSNVNDANTKEGGEKFG